jgi:ABC-2 type transport system permease protein
MNSLLQLLLVHLRTFIREPAILFWAILFPILMAWVLGIAFSNSGETARTVYVTSPENSAETISGTKIFGKNTRNALRVKFENHTLEEAVRAIKRGVITLYVEVRNDSIIYHYDPANTEAHLTHLMIERELQFRGPAKSVVMPLETKGTRYIDFLIPGMIALGIMNSCLWGISWNLIETRMKKLLRRMVATPMRKTIFLASHIIIRVFLGGIESLFLFAFAYFYFGTEITGSILAFVLVFLSGIAAFSGIAILIASRTEKSEIGNGLINVVTLPMMILSGIFFNYHNFPEWAVSFIRFLPLTLLADSFRSIFIEGAGIRDVSFAILVLAGTSLLTFTLGLKVFKWY